MSEQTMVDVMKRFEKLTADFKIPSSDLSGRASRLILEPAAAYCGSNDVRPCFLSCKNPVG